MEKKTFGFPKAEHLKSKTIIDKLYSEGQSVAAFPLRAVFLPLEKYDEKQPHATILINVAKKRFRHAVDRNLIKRRIREAYRLNKQPFINELERMKTKMAVAILYIDNNHSSTAILQKRMTKLLASILEKRQKQCNSSL
ncbi:MAG: ribonuclease P protein component [Bacteroidaceae bacterium]|nr:ribonuclease P protein component [Bacteroidaceae bacterium]